MIKYFKFAIREFLGLENDYESILSNQEEILQQLQELKKVEIENQGLILEEKQTSYYDYITLKNLLLLLVLLGFIGGGLWFYNSASFDVNNINSLASELNKNIGELSQSLANSQHINLKDISVLLEKLNTNIANLSEKELQMLNEIVNHSRAIRGVVQPNPSGSNPIRMPDIKDIVWGEHDE